MKNALIILAYNEEPTLNEVITKYKTYFNKLVIVDDASTDGTKDILNKLRHNNNIEIISNKKNLGAGKSLEKGLEYCIKNKFDYVVKIDGDDQFLIDDVLTIIEIQNKNLYDYIKCDRFWENGVVGNMPTIRYLGNTLASIFLKFASGFNSSNDPLNGLMSIKTTNLAPIKLPKKFHRYGYPFFYSLYFYEQALRSDIKIAHFKNTVIYRNEKSYLSPLVMLQKLIRYTFKNKVRTISTKLKSSNLQPSALLDISAIISTLLTVYSFVKILSIRYFAEDGSQTNWLILLIIFFIGLIFCFVKSIQIQSSILKNKLIKLN